MERAKVGLINNILNQTIRYSFKQGCLKGFPIFVGYLPIALTFGVLAAGTGLSVFESTAMSVWVFAGASQFIALELIGKGTAVYEIIVATFILNLRHLLMSTTLAQRFKGEKIFGGLLSFGITDETFVVATVDEDNSKLDQQISTPYLAGIILTAYSGWIIGTIIGTMFAELIPVAITNSMGIALYAMFIGLLVPSIRKVWRIGVIALCSALIAWICKLSGLSTGWGIVIATLVGSFIGSFFIDSRNQMKGDYGHE